MNARGLENAPENRAIEENASKNIGELNQFEKQSKALDLICRACRVAVFHQAGCSLYGIEEWMLGFFDFGAWSSKIVLLRS